MHIIGTAGHVDHGKSSLVAALTGTNPDRWIEEQLRGMTLDLGFAHLRFEDGAEAGIVDVPGHARFLHNMLAGAAGMELLLLVVAADDGVMPQTIEHLQILRYLNVARTVVALTKIDAVEPALRPQAEERVRERLRGTIAQGAPLVATSTVTGEGLSDLVACLQRELAAVPSRSADAPVYLPVDRVFTLAGRGTIVTGTLMQGRIDLGNALTIEPLGRDVRVRSIQVFGEQRDRVEPGTRAALNLAGVDRDEIARGAVLVSGRSAARTQYEVMFTPVDEEAARLLRRRTHVRVHIGSAEVLGTLVFGEVPDAERTVRAQLFLRAPVHAFAGVRFVVRRLTPKTLLGGGEIAGLNAAVLVEEHDAADEIAEFLRARVLDPADIAAIAFAANVREDVARMRLDALLERGDVVALSRPQAYLHAQPFADVAKQLISQLEAVQQSEPWTMGTTSLALSRARGIAEPLLVRILNALVDEGRIAARHGYFSTVDYVPKLSAEQRGFFERAVPLDSARPFLPAPYDDVAAQVRGSPIAGLPKAFDTLLARGVLVKVGEALYRGTQIDAAHERIEAFIDRNGSMTMAQFRDLLGTSRKYAVPLLEWLDARGITVRSGDVRMLRMRRGNRQQSVQT